MANEQKEESQNSSTSLAFEDFKAPNFLKNTTAEYDLTSDIPYITNGHARHVLDIYLPKSNPTNESFPTIIYIHGGAFMAGSKDTDVLPLRYLEKSYAVATIHYRLSGDAIFPAAVQDCKAAVRWLRAHAQKYNLDPNRFVSMGDSAGGYMALMVGITGGLRVAEFQNGEYLDVSSEVQGVVDYYGPTDFTRMDEQAPSHATLKHDPQDSPESKFIGAQVSTAPALCSKASPLTYIHDKTPPILIGHGTKDSIVPFPQAELLVEAMKAKGQPVELHAVEGADHVWGGITPEQMEDLLRDTDAWFKQVFGR